VTEIIANQMQMLGAPGGPVETSDSEKEVSIGQETIPGPDDDVPF